MTEFLRACVVARLNIIVSGGTGSGKTTLLNSLSGFIPENERILTIEDAAELRLQQDHVLRLETRSSNLDGTGATTVRDLVRNALRMRPDRIVVGECRGGEALDMLQAMNTGHEGSLTTLHANAPRDALSRLETMVLMAGVDLPLRVVRQQIASAVDLIVQVARLKDGSRRLTSITEVAGMEADTIVMTDIFKFEQTGIDAAGRVSGELRPTGIRPLFSPRLEAAGMALKADVFGSTIADMISQRQRR
jgi:pilus assembly protein CpaF